MRKLLLSLLLAAAACAPAQAEVWHARYGVGETFDFVMYNTDGTLKVNEVDGGTAVSVSCNEGTETTATNDYVDRGTFYSIALTATEMQCKRITVVITGTVTQVFFIETNSNASAMTPTNDVNLVNIAGSAVSTTTAQLGVNTVQAGATAWGSGAITAASIATDAITAAKIAADSIGASEMAADAIGASELADGAIDAAALATDTLTAAKVAADVSTEFSAAVFTVNATQVSGDSTAATNLKTSFNDTVGAQRWVETVDQGTAQAATGTTIQLRAAAAFADSELVGNRVFITGGTTGVGQSRLITAYTGATDTATVAVWSTTPTGTITYQVKSDTAASSGVAPTAAQNAAAVWDEARSGHVAGGSFGERVIADTTLIGGSSAAATALSAQYAGTAGSVAAAGIADQGTAQAATATTIQLRSAATFADSVANGMTVVACGSTQGYCQSRAVTAYVGSTDTATVDTWTVTPSGTVTYVLYGTAPVSSTGGVSIAAGGITTASFAAGAIDANAIATDAIGAAEIATDAIGANEIATDAIGAAEIAASAIGTSELADGGITSAEFAAGAITASVIATDAIGAAELASDASPEIATSVWVNATRTLSAGTNIVLAKGTGITGLNDLSAAQVNTEADTALTDIFLDKLFAASYDPATKPGAAGGLLNVLMENNGGVPRYTAAALVQAPSGGGGGSTNVLTIEGVDATDQLDARIAAAGLASSLTTLTNRIGVPSNVGTGSTLAANLVDIENETDDIGVNGAGLTAVDDAVMAALTALPTSIRDIVVEDQGSTVSLGCALSALVAYASGDIVTVTDTTTYKDPSNAETRITGTVSSPGNRTATITCPTYP